MYLEQERYFIKNKWNLIPSIIQLSIGILTIITFIIIAISGEDITRWLITLIIAFVFVISGIIGIIDYKIQK